MKPARYETLQDLLDPVVTLKGISRFVNIGVDLWKLPLDEPVIFPLPAPPASGAPGRTNHTRWTCGDRRFT